MQKIFTILAAVILGTSALTAQNTFLGGYRAWTFSVQGGPLYSLNENQFAYTDEGLGYKLISMQGSFAVGHEFSHDFGMRVSVGFGGNRAAGNKRETNIPGLYPYNFKSVNAFADATFNLAGNTGKGEFFSPILYAGVGLGYSYGFYKPEGYGVPQSAWGNGGDWKIHPFEKVINPYIKEQNTAIAFRGGFIADFNISELFGAYIDLCAEAYDDGYNGLQPSVRDHGTGNGYAGFPFDLRFIISAGIIVRLDY